MSTDTNETLRRKCHDIIGLLPDDQAQALYVLAVATASVLTAIRARRLRYYAHVERIAKDMDAKEAADVH